MSIINTNATYSPKRNIILRIALAIFVFFVACGDKGEIEPSQNAAPIELETGSFTGLDAQQVTLFGSVKTLNGEEVLDHGFLIQTVEKGNNAPSEHVISLGKHLEVGDVRHTFIPEDIFEQHKEYNYCFYIRTTRNFYKGKINVFVLNNIVFSSLPRRYSYGRDTITLTGNFEGLDDNYRLKVSGAFDLFDLPYTLNPDKKSLTFIVGANNQTQHGSQIEISLIRKGANTTSYQQHVTQIQYLARVNPPAKKQYNLYDLIELSSTNIAPLYDNDSRVKLLINDVQIPYTRYLRLYSLKSLKGDTFRFGYSNGHDSVYFPDPITLELPTDVDMRLNRTVIHPYTAIDVKSERFMYYFFDLFETHIGTKLATAHYNQWNKMVNVFVEDITEGEHDMVFSNRFYAATSSQKITVKNLRWTTLDKDNGYFGENVVAAGNFIAGHDYRIFDENNRPLGSCLGSDGKLNITINSEFDGIKGLKIGHPKGPFDVIIADKIIAFKSNGFTFDRMYPKKGTTGEILTIEGKGIAYATQFMLGDQRLEPIVLNNNKVTFSIPFILGKGLMRFNYVMNGKLQQSEDLFELY